MQTFAPSPDLDECARVLDRQRLGKQRVESLQLLYGITMRNGDGTPKTATRSWGQHPVGLMWADALPGLLRYQDATIREWRRRGYRDTCWVKSKLALFRVGLLDARLDPEEDAPLPAWYHAENPLPWWWGDASVHASHRAALLLKFPEHYSAFGWSETPAYDYVWPARDLVRPTA